MSRCPVQGRMALGTRRFSRSCVGGSSWSRCCRENDCVGCCVGCCSRGGGPDGRGTVSRLLVPCWRACPGSSRFSVARVKSCNSISRWRTAKEVGGEVVGLRLRLKPEKRFVLGWCHSSRMYTGDGSPKHAEMEKQPVGVDVLAAGRLAAPCSIMWRPFPSFSSSKMTSIILPRSNIGFGCLS